MSVSTLGVSYGPQRPPRQSGKPNRGNFHNSITNLKDFTNLCHFNNPWNLFSFFAHTKREILGWLSAQNLIASTFLCPHCHVKCYLGSRPERLDGFTFRCPRSSCHEFTVRTNSIWSHFRYSIPDIIVFLIHFAKGYSLKICADKTGINYNSMAPRWAKILRMCIKERIWREYFGQGDLSKCIKLSGVVQLDEMFLGRKVKFHRGRKLGKGVWIFGLIETETGRVLLFPIDRRDNYTLCMIVENFVEYGSRLDSDTWPGYVNFHELPYDHFSSCHKDVFSQAFQNIVSKVVFTVNSNMMEGYWKILRQMFRNMNGSTSHMIESHLMVAQWRRYCQVEGVDEVEQLSEDIKLVYSCDKPGRITHPTKGLIYSFCWSPPVYNVWRLDSVEFTGDGGSGDEGGSNDEAHSDNPHGHGSVDDTVEDTEHDEGASGVTSPSDRSVMNEALNELSHEFVPLPGTPLDETVPNMAEHRETGREPSATTSAVCESSHMSTSSNTKDAASTTTCVQIEDHQKSAAGPDVVLEKESPTADTCVNANTSATVSSRRRVLHYSKYMEDAGPDTQSTSGENIASTAGSSAATGGLTETDNESSVQPRQSNIERSADESQIEYVQEKKKADDLVKDLLSELKKDLNKDRTQAPRAESSGPSAFNLNDSGTYTKRANKRRISHVSATVEKDMKKKSDNAADNPSLVNPTVLKSPPRVQRKEQPDKKEESETTTLLLRAPLKAVSENTVSSKGITITPYTGPIVTVKKSQSTGTVNTPRSAPRSTPETAEQSSEKCTPSSGNRNSEANKTKELAPPGPAPADEKLGHAKSITAPAEPDIDDDNIVIVSEIKSEPATKSGMDVVKTEQMEVVIDLTLDDDDDCIIEESPVNLAKVKEENIKASHVIDLTDSADSPSRAEPRPSRTFNKFKKLEGFTRIKIERGADTASESHLIKSDIKKEPADVLAKNELSLSSTKRPLPVLPLIKVESTSLDRTEDKYQSGSSTIQKKKLKIKKEKLDTPPRHREESVVDPTSLLDSPPESPVIPPKRKKSVLVYECTTEDELPDLDPGEGCSNIKQNSPTKSPSPRPSTSSGGKKPKKSGAARNDDDEEKEYDERNISRRRQPEYHNEITQPYGKARADRLKEKKQKITNMKFQKMEEKYEAIVQKLHTAKTVRYNDDGTVAKKRGRPKQAITAAERRFLEEYESTISKKIDVGERVYKNGAVVGIIQADGSTMDVDPRDYAEFAIPHLQPELAELARQKRSTAATSSTVTQSSSSARPSAPKKKPSTQEERLARSDRVLEDSDIFTSGSQDSDVMKYVPNPHPTSDQRNAVLDKVLRELKDTLNVLVEGLSVPSTNQMNQGTGNQRKAKEAALQSLTDCTIVQESYVDNIHELVDSILSMGIPVKAILTPDFEVNQLFEH